MRYTLLIILFCAGCDSNSDPVLAQSVANTSLICLLSATGFYRVFDGLMGRELRPLHRFEQLVSTVCLFQVGGSAVCFVLTRSFLPTLACLTVALGYLFIARLTSKFLLLDT